MIIREIARNTIEVIKKFDWFNDYTDTRNWAKWNCSEVLEALDKGYVEWQRKQAENYKINTS